MIMAIDFGTCNTVLARWNPATRRVETLKPGNLSRTYRYLPPGAGQPRESSVIPSLIHYGESGTLLAGAQVETTGLTGHRGTFQWLKLNLLNKDDKGRRVNGEMIRPSRAGEDLIGEILLAAAGSGGDDLVLTVPVEAFDQYTDWLESAVLKSYRGTVRMIDEATACILGYDAHVREGDLYLVFDFGGGTLDVSVVKVEDLTGDTIAKCRVLGRGGEEIGGSLIDQWLLAELQHKAELDDQDIADLGASLLRAVEEAKIRLSGGEEQVEINRFNDISARLISHTFTAGDLRRILNASQDRLRGDSLYGLVTKTVDRALDMAMHYKVLKKDIKGVFMAGGSSLLLGVSDHLRNSFPGIPVRCEDPFEAIARGACRYAGEDINLALVHDYCVRSWNAKEQEWDLVPVVPKGTRYPTEKTVNRTLAAACDGATTIGLVVHERSGMVRPESIFTLVGGRLTRVETGAQSAHTLRELNPRDREFIHAVPPCTVGDKRFVIGFGVDANKRLTLSLLDRHPDNRSYVQLSSGEKLPLPVQDLPLVKL